MLFLQRIEEYKNGMRMGVYEFIAEEKISQENAVEICAETKRHEAKRSVPSKLICSDFNGESFSLDIY